VAGGLLVGLLGWFAQDRGNAMLAVLKIVVTPVCYSSGNAGGVFGPGLFIGATIGAATRGSCSSVTAFAYGNSGGLRARRHSRAS
jgi:H+/Cl- antiporter ClcA